MAKKYEVTIQKTNARCIIHDVDDVNGAWVFYPEKICIFTVDDKTNTIKPLVEFRTSRTLLRDEVYFTLELENPPCTKSAIPKPLNFSLCQVKLGTCSTSEKMWLM